MLLPPSPAHKPGHFHPSPAHKLGSWRKWQEKVKEWISWDTSERVSAVSRDEVRWMLWSYWSRQTESDTVSCDPIGRGSDDIKTRSRKSLITRAIHQEQVISPESSGPCATLCVMFLKVHYCLTYWRKKGFMIYFDPVFTLKLPKNRQAGKNRFFTRIILVSGKWTQLDRHTANQRNTKPAPFLINDWVNRILTQLMSFVWVNWWILLYFGLYLVFF